MLGPDEPFMFYGVPIGEPSTAAMTNYLAEKERKFKKHIKRAFSIADPYTGMAMAASTAMIAMTTSSSIRVKAFRFMLMEARERGRS